MWVRYNTAPWWGRWLITSVWMTAWLVLFYWALLPRGHWSTPWPAWITVVGLVVVGLLVAAPITQLGKPGADSYATVLRGLSATQRAQVGRALRGGSIPTDSAVLGAAVRAMDLARAYRERVSPGQRCLMWMIIAVFGVVMPVLQFVGNQPRMAVLYLTAGVIMLASRIGPIVMRRRRRRRVHLVELRAAAEADPQAAAVVADAVPPAVPTLRQRLVQVGLAVAVVVPVSVGAVLVSSAAELDCRTAAAVVAIISEQRELLDPSLIGPGGPELAEYRDLAARLQRRADQVSDPTIRQHLHDIAGLSGVAVIVVGQAREPGMSGEGLKGFQTHYGNLMAQLVEADRGLVGVCA